MKLIVGFSTTNSLVSRVIRWFVKDKVSHTYIKFYDEFLGAWLIMHADWPGVIIEDAELFEIHNTVIEEYEIDDPRLKATLRKNLRHLRKKYDYWNTIGWAWVITFKRWSKKKFRNLMDDPKKLMCTDFVARFIGDNYEVSNEQFNPKTWRRWMDDNHKQHNWKKREL